MMKNLPSGNPLQDSEKVVVPVLGGHITPIDLDRAVKRLIKLIGSGSRGYICIANVHTITLAMQDLVFKNALNNALFVVADGMPVVWCVRAAGYSQIGRVYGADLVRAVCVAGVSRGLRHGFFGGLDGVASTMALRLAREVPGIRIAGVWNPGILDRGEPTPSHILESINQSRCDVLWVGLGAPKQEIWMAQHQSSLNVSVMVGVGQAFDILAGRTSEPPRWAATHGLEWFYRLIREPRRLWRRYLYYNAVFVCYIFLEMLRSRSPWDKPLK